MPIDPTTGRIISTSNLSLKDTDELQIPRNSQIGPSRTAQNRKQLRTAFYQNVLASRSEFANAIANNPLILQLIDDVETLELFQPTTSVWQGPTPAIPNIVIQRVEDGSGNVHIYSVVGEFNLYVTNDDPTPSLDVEIAFPGTLNWHAFTGIATVADGANGTPAAADLNYYEETGTDEDFVWSVPLDPNSNWVRISFTGQIACFSEVGAFNVTLTAVGNDTVVSNLSTGSCTVQLTDQVFPIP